MRIRPWPLVILALLYWLEPFFSAALNAHLSQAGYWHYLVTSFHQETAWSLLEQYGLYPLAGIAIFAMKAWSYPIFMAVTIFGVVREFEAWRSMPHFMTVAEFLSFTFLNFGLVTYFLIPSVRKVYFNRHLRWWEAKRRYAIHVPAELQTPGRPAEKVKCIITNISEGGVFIKCAKNFESEGTLLLHFSLMGRKIVMDTCIVHRGTTGIRGYGLQFIHSATSRAMMKQVIQGLICLGLDPTSKTPHLKESFHVWLSRLCSTGKGIVPELPAGGGRSISENINRIKRIDHAKKRIVSETRDIA